MKPFVTVIIPTYNSAHTIHITLDSLKRQSYKNIEIIVVDDGSTDNTKDILKDYNVKYLQQKNQGPAGARNLGLKHAKGEIIVFTDADCKVPTHFISAFISGYERYNVAGVGGYMEAHKGVANYNPFAFFEKWRSKHLFGIDPNKEILGGIECPAGGTNSVSYKKKVLEEVEGFNPSLRTGEEMDLKKKICDKGYKILFIPIKVEHFHEYSLQRFLQQAIQRGTGKDANKKMVYVKFLLYSPLIFYTITKKIIKYRKKKLHKL
jgi:glycosyltransferase involved in cell wall biosynthesis